MALLDRPPQREAAHQPQDLDQLRSLGARHLNAALGRMRAGSGVDAVSEGCLLAARQEYGSDGVTAAQDLMVLGVERP